MSEFTFSGLTLQNGKLLCSNSCYKFHTYICFCLAQFTCRNLLFTYFWFHRLKLSLHFSKFLLWDFFSFPFLFVIIANYHLFAECQRNKYMFYAFVCYWFFQQKMQGSWIVRQSVGSTPCLLGKAVDCNYIRGPKYLEVIFHWIYLHTVVYSCCKKFLSNECCMLPNLFLMI